MSTLIGFPDTVDERAARVVAGGVVALTTTSLVTDRPWLLAPVAGGFAARVLTGPKLSPLALFATRVVVPRLPGPDRPVPGSPKRLAQGMGFTLSLTSLVLARRGRRRASRAVLAMLIGAAGLEAFAGICLACKMFPYLARLGLVNGADCPDCANPWDRLHHHAHLRASAGEDDHAHPPARSEGPAGHADLPAGVRPAGHADLPALGEVPGQRSDLRAGAGEDHHCAEPGPVGPGGASRGDDATPGVEAARLASG